MQKAQLIATVLGAAVLAFGAAQAGPMGGGPVGGMGPGMQPSPTGTLSGAAPDQTFNTNSTQSSCDQNMASRIPCPTHKTKAKADSKAKGAASADQTGSNANAPTFAAGGQEPRPTPPQARRPAVRPAQEPHRTDQGGP